MLYFSRWKTILIWLSVVVAVIFAFPNVLSKEQVAKLPSWIPHTQMTLGLDLQGGSHILLQVDRADIVKDRVTSTVEDVRRILRDEGIGYTGLGPKGQGVQVRIRDNAQIDAAKKALQELAQPVNAGMFGGGNVQEITISEPNPGMLRLALTDDGIDYRVRTAVGQSIEVVSRRVNELGTTEPIIQREGNDRILVQVPGLQDPQRLKDILGQTAKLTFRLVDTSMPVQEAVQGRPPSGSEILPDAEDPNQKYLIQRRVLVSGEDLVDAQAGFDQRTTSRSSPSASTRREPSASARRRSRTSASLSRSYSTTRSSLPPSSASLSSAALARSPAILLSRAPTTWPSF